MLESIIELVKPLVNLAAPMFWAGAILLIIGIVTIRRKTNGGIVIGSIFAIGGFFGILSASSINPNAPVAGSVSLIGVITLVVVFIGSVLMIITKGWISKLFGIALGFFAYLELERITPADTLLGEGFRLIRYGVEQLLSLIEQLLSLIAGLFS